MGYESTLFVKCISNSRKGYKAKENTWNFQVPLSLVLFRKIKCSLLLTRFLLSILWTPS